MENLHDDMLNQLGTRLRGYEEAPDDRVWSGIQQNLHPVPPARSRSKKAMILAVIAALTICWSDTNVGTLNNQPELSLPIGQRSSPSVESNAEEPTLSDSKIVEQKISANQNASTKKIVTNTNPTATTDKTSSISRTSQQDNNSNQAFVAPIDTVDALLIDTKVPNTSTISNNSNIYSGPDTTTAVAVKSGTRLQDSLTKSNPTLIPTRPKRGQGLNVTMAITPSLAYTNISPIANDDILVTRVIKPSILSSERLGVAVAVGLQGSITPKLEYTGTLSYYSYNQTLTYFYRHAAENSAEKTGEDLSFEIRPAEREGIIQLDKRIVGFQGGLLYLIKEGRLAQKAGLALTWQKDLGTSTPGSSLTYQLLYRNEYRVNSKWNFFVQPGFSYPLVRKEQSIGPMNLKPYQVNFTFGVIYQLR